MNSRESLKSICENFLTSPTPTWEAKYNFVFAVGFHEAVEKVLGKLPDYYDPDSSYEEDVKAFLNAILKEIDIDTAAKQAESLVLSDSTPAPMKKTSW